MCGITGIYAKNMIGKMHMIHLSNATEQIARRGPDARGVWMNDFVGLGHRRLSIIDTSYNASQPMKDASGRYRIVYNGEVYNFRELKKDLISHGYAFHSDSDTEVLLYAYIHYKEKCLDLLNGFFAFSIYDEQENSLFMARDRYGIKPLYYLDDEDKLLFASDMHSMLAYGIERELDLESLYTYLQLNYTPAPDTMIKGVKMLMPGHYAFIDKKGLKIHEYYQLPDTSAKLLNQQGSYENQQRHLRGLMEESVKARLVADVPLGTFLSGGIDSSIISGIARKYKEDLHTFSIGYADEPFFDETKYANLVAKKFDTNHTVFSLTNDDLYAHLFDILDRMDQPFADSSAIPTYILSERTRQYITVSLSGDGADELFSGYNKHAAHLRAMQGSPVNSLLRIIGPLLKHIPKSRNGTLSNKFRQAEKYTNGLALNQKDRYWAWASVASGHRAMGLLHQDIRNKVDRHSYSDRKEMLLESIKSEKDFNELLRADMQLVLPNDMLRKMDLMSMANGLEVRVPFLDHQLVDFVSRLPASSKINGQMRKRILQDAFRDMLPAELYQRPKKGFEVPLLKWFRTSLRSMIDNDLLGEGLIRQQGLFDLNETQRLKKQLFSINPGDSHATVWALIVFQWWWKKYFT